MEVNINFVPVESDHGRAEYFYDKLGRQEEKRLNIDGYSCLKTKNEYKYGTTNKQKITAKLLRRGAFGGFFESL